SLNNNEGTYVKEVSQVEKMLVRGVTRDNDCARIALCGVEDTPGKAFQVFELIAKAGISVDLIIQSIGDGISKDISFTVKEEELDAVLKLLEDNKNIIKAREVKSTKDVSKVSIVGAGMVNNSGVAARMFEALSDAHINIKMIATSEIKISVLVARKEAEAAVVAIHDKFLSK
ncbi:MAG: ACT domain-containing protein, partial [Candidatus Ornithomonoglobus sp.]